MKHLVLVGCSKSKREGYGPARVIYTSALFRKSLSVGLLLGDEVLILSTKYGVIHPDQTIHSYDETFSASAGKQSSIDPKLWARKVAAALALRGDERRIALAGDAYLRHLRPLIEIHEEPLRGLGLGRRLQWLTRRQA